MLTTSTTLRVLIQAFEDDLGGTRAESMRQGIDLDPRRAQQRDRVRLFQLTLLECMRIGAPDAIDLAREQVDVDSNLIAVAIAAESRLDGFQRGDEVFRVAVETEFDERAKTGSGSPKTGSRSLTSL